MPVEDVFSITGRGTVATGRIERGVVHVSDEVELVGLAEETRKIVCTGVEMFRKLLDEGQAGDNVGLLLRGIQRTEIERGQVLSKPGTINPHTKFKAQVYVLKKEEGGRHTPFFNGSEVVISGRYESSLSIETSVHYSDGIETYINSATSASADKKHIEYIWAQQKIDQLLETAELQGVTETLREEITDLALYYGIVVGGYTAILVTAYEVDKDAGEGDEPTEPAATVTTTRGAIPPPPATTTATYATTTPAAPPPAPSAIDPVLAGVPSILGFLLVAVPLLCIWKLKRE